MNARYRGRSKVSFELSGDDRITRVFKALCKTVNSPVSLGLWLRWKYGEHEQLAAFSINPNDYRTDGSSEGFAQDLLVSSFLSKYKGLKLSYRTKDVALAGFAAAEESCRTTNSRLRKPDPHGRLAQVMYLAQRKISDILGDVNHVRFDSCGWGPGSTFSLSGERSSLVDKLCEERISVTLGALKYAQVGIGQDIHWLQARGIPADAACTLLPSEFLIVKGNKVTTVSKNAKTDRVIAMEPTANIFMQKAIGSHIRRCLSKVGVDLNDQSVNQHLASIAFRDGLATVDLKAASDTISKQLVFQLLPYDWFVLLDDLRSKSYSLNGKWSDYHKFSSMGNGFTFELESLIFYAITCAVCSVTQSSGTISVYGDDIICPSSALPLLAEVLDYVGFQVNASKTHSSSAYRESCGKHYFLGGDVTPIYQKEIPNELQEIYRLANRIRRFAIHSGAGVVSDSVYRTTWLASLDGVAIKHVLYLGSQEDTGVLLSDEDFRSLGIFRPNPGEKSPQLVFQPTSFSADNRVLYAYWLRFRPDEPFRGRLSVRRKGRYVIRKRRLAPIQLDALWS